MRWTLSELTFHQDPTAKVSYAFLLNNIDLQIFTCGLAESDFFLVYIILRWTHQVIGGIVKTFIEEGDKLFVLFGVGGASSDELKSMMLWKSRDCIGIFEKNIFVGILILFFVVGEFAIPFHFEGEFFGEEGACVVSNYGPVFHEIDGLVGFDYSKYRNCEL